MGERVKWGYNKKRNASIEIPQRPRTLKSLSPNQVSINLKAFNHFSERFAPEKGLPRTLLKQGSLTYANDNIDSSAFLTCTNLESNIHRVHDVFLLKIARMSAITLLQ